MIVSCEMSNAAGNRAYILFYRNNLHHRDMAFINIHLIYFNFSLSHGFNYKTGDRFQDTRFSISTK